MESLPGTRVLMLTVSTADDIAVGAIADATGYLQKHSGPEELADALECGPRPLAHTVQNRQQSLRDEARPARTRWQMGPGSDDRPGGGDPQDVRRGKLLSPHSGG